MNREERNSLIGTMTTLCYLEKDDSYLMLHRVKKKNDVNQDKWIGVGGHALAYESPEDCLLREVKEETGLTLTSYRFRGIVTFALKDVETQYMCLHLLQSELSVFSSGEQGKTRKSGGVSDAEAIECARKQQLSVKSL